MTPLILNLGTTWQKTVGFVPLPLDLRVKSDRYLLNRRLRRSHSRCGCSGK